MNPMQMLMLQHMMMGQGGQGGMAPPMGGMPGGMPGAPPMGGMPMAPPPMAPPPTGGIGQPPSPAMPEQQMLSEGLTSPSNKLGALLAQAGGQPVVSGDPNNNPAIDLNTLTQNPMDADKVDSKPKKKAGRPKGGAPSTGMGSWISQMMGTGGNP